MFEATFDDAMEELAYEAFECKLSIKELAAKLDRQQIIDRAIASCTKNV
jgi:hypothetical protein